MRFRSAAVLAMIVVAHGPSLAQENYESWEPLKPLFESTGGGGIMIGDYDPVVTGNTCATDFSVHEPGGKVSINRVVFDAVPTQGGILCTNGKWRATSGDASGTTPFRVFIKDGVKRGQ